MGGMIEGPRWGSDPSHSESSEQPDEPGASWTAEAVNDSRALSERGDHPSGSPQQLQRPAKAEEGLRPKSSVTAMVGTAIAALALVAAGVSASFAYQQAESTRIQLQGQQRAQDLDAAASVRVALDDDVIELNTLQTFTPNNAHIWLVGESDGALVEVESILKDIPSCSRIEFSTSQILAQATDEDGRDFQENYGGAASFVELSLAFQAPSGGWFVIDNQGRMEGVSEQSVQDDFDWHTIRRYALAPDTYWEGYSERDALEISPITVGGEFQMTSDGGFEADIAQLDCF